MRSRPVHPPASARGLRVGALAALLVVAASWTSACMPIPPPDVLAELGRVRAAPATRLAQEDAPAAHAVAEKLRRDAGALFDADDLAGSQITGEQALAAYDEAVAQARTARAEAQHVVLAAQADAAAKRLAELDVEHQKLGADIAALEDRLQVLRDAEPIHPSDGAPADRERARLATVKTLHHQARLLCVAGRLLAESRRLGGRFEDPRELSEAVAGLAALEGVLAGGPAAAPIDQVTRARAACLRALAAVRRAGDDVSRAPGADDALLAALSETGRGTVRRDDRGVVVTLRGLFGKGALSGEGGKVLDDLAGVAARYPAFPIMVVLHQHTAPDPQAEMRWREWGRQLVAALESKLRGRLVAPSEIAGVAAPAVDPTGPYRQRNERVEIVFVTPQSQ